MKQKEILILEHGQPKLNEFPHAADILRREKSDLWFIFSEFVSMPKRAGLHDINISYFFDNIFENMVEEKFVSEIQPIKFFTDIIEKLKTEHSGIVRLRVDHENESINFHVFIKEPSWELEELIYNNYCDLLNKFQTQSFNLKVTELFK